MSAACLKVEFSDTDHVRSGCDVDCIGATRADVVQMISVTYTDDFERRDGVWKIARRAVAMYYFNPINGAEMSAPWLITVSFFAYQMIDKTNDYCQP